MVQSIMFDMKQIGVGSAIIGPLEKKYVLDVLKKQRLSYGFYHEKFENEFAPCL